MNINYIPSPRGEFHCCSEPLCVIISTAYVVSLQQLPFNIVHAGTLVEKSIDIFLWTYSGRFFDMFCPLRHRTLKFLTSSLAVGRKGGSCQFATSSFNKRATKSGHLVQYSDISLASNDLRACLYSDRYSKICDRHIPLRLR
jgi:hypothetical protein